MVQDVSNQSVLVLGVGNLLLRDEGLGVQALHSLTQTGMLPECVRLIDGGTLGLDLLPYLEDAQCVLILDAIQSGQPPGTLVRLEGDDIAAALALKMSLHQVGLHDLLAVCRLRGTLPPRMVVWGIEPALLEWGIDLSPVVAAALPLLVTAVRDELRTWGYDVSRCTGQQSPDALMSK